MLLILKNFFKDVPKVIVQIGLRHLPGIHKVVHFETIKIGLDRFLRIKFLSKQESYWLAKNAKVAKNVQYGCISRWSTSVQFEWILCAQFLGVLSEERQIQFPPFSGHAFTVSEQRQGLELKKILSLILCTTYFLGEIIQFSQHPFYMSWQTHKTFVVALRVL